MECSIVKGFIMIDYALPLNPEDVKLRIMVAIQTIGRKMSGRVWD
jgi:hypothetical protein